MAAVTSDVPDAMAGLYDPARHEPLQAADWSDDVARDAIQRIAAAAEAAFDPLGRRAHPQDDAADPETRYFSLYEGNGGVLWALHSLAVAGLARSEIDFAAASAHLVEPNRETLAGSLHGHASYLLGDAGLLLLQWRLNGNAGVLDALYRCVEGNLHNPVREALWGNPGTLVAALHVADLTGEPRWARLIGRAVQALHDEMQRDPEAGTWVWEQDLYGSRRRLLGAGHGFAGNAYPMLRAARWVGADVVHCVAGRALATLQATALRADGGANWHPMIDAERAAGRLPLVQDCHGAPGIVCRFGTAPRTPEWDELLRAAGELVWHAGPVRKGPTLCHGTAGNAYAFLKLYRRFGDPQWLDRARAFALHAVAQVDAARALHGRPRDSLWTGDLGVACLLRSCIGGDDRFPTLDVF